MQNWQRTQILWWKGILIKRNSKEYQILLDRAYEALFKNEKFKNALKASENAILTHNIGRTKESETILTRSEFCSRLMKLREYGKLS